MIYCVMLATPTSHWLTASRRQRRGIVRGLLAAYRRLQRSGAENRLVTLASAEALASEGPRSCVVTALWLFRDGEIARQTEDWLRASVLGEHFTFVSMIADPQPTRTALFAPLVDLPTLPLGYRMPVTSALYGEMATRGKNDSESVETI